MHLAWLVHYDESRATIDLEQFLMNQLLKLFIAANILTMGFCSSAKETPNPLMASGSVVWAGLDYSLVRMIGDKSTEHGFIYPNLIFPTMLNSWNQLFLNERIERIAKKMDKDVIVDIGGVTERNMGATAKQIILSPGPQDGIEESHITPQDIAAEVQSFKLDQTNGLGLVFIIDRLVHEYHPAPATGGQGKARLHIQPKEPLFMWFSLMLPHGMSSPLKEGFMVWAAALFGTTGFARSKSRRITI